MKIVLSLFCLALCATLAPADSCRQRVIQHVQQVQAVDYQQQYAAAVYVPLVVAVPQYSAGYSAEALFGRGQPQQPAVADTTLAELLLEVRKIRSEVEQIKSGGKPPEIVPVPPNKIEPLPPLPVKSSKVTETRPHVKVFLAKCASCHESAVAEKKGGGFKLLDDGGLVWLNDSQRLKIASSLYTGRMPKNDKCTDEEVHQIMVWLDSVK